MPPSVELLGPMTPQFSNPDPRPTPHFQTRLTPMYADDAGTYPQPAHKCCFCCRGHAEDMEIILSLVPKFGKE